MDSDPIFQAIEVNSLSNTQKVSSKLGISQSNVVYRVER